MTIRKATQEDLQQIQDMAQVVFRQTYKEILSAEQMEYMMDMMYSSPNLIKQLEEGHHYYIASEDDVSLGYVSIQADGMDENGVEIFHLHKIYVMPQAQGRGVGRLLFEKVISHVRSEMRTSSARVELNVNRYNKSVEFYRHLGMRVLLEEDFPIGNGFYKTDYIMGLDLSCTKKSD